MSREINFVVIILVLRLPLVDINSNTKFDNDTETVDEKYFSNILKGINILIKFIESL